MNSCAVSYTSHLFALLLVPLCGGYSFQVVARVRVTAAVRITTGDISIPALMASEIYLANLSNPKRQQPQNLGYRDALW